MAIDAYSPCPGGTGKKIKFCCHDLLSDLETIDRMIAGEQFHACLRHIERVEEKTPDRACLLALKCQLTQSLGNAELYRATVERFVAKHPDNTIANAELAMLRADSGEDPRLAMEALQRAFEVASDALEPQTYEAVGAVADAMRGRHYLAAKALAELQVGVGGQDRAALDRLVRINQLESMPLILKDAPDLIDDPGNVPWRDEYLQAWQSVQRARWREALPRFEALAERTSSAPLLWHQVASLRARLGDEEGAAAALRSFAGLDVPWEDAIEAEAQAALLAKPPVGDRVDVLTLTYDVSAPDELAAALAMSRQVVSMPVNAAAFPRQVGPPPRGMYLLLDRPRVEQFAAESGTDQIPRHLGQMLLFGRETDRPARLEVFNVSARKVERTQAALAQIAGSALEISTLRRKTLGLVPMVVEMLQLDWQLPEDIAAEQLERLIDVHIRDAVLQRWTKRPQSILDGKTPEEVAGQLPYRTRLMAATLLLESWLEFVDAEFDVNELRRQLGLPLLEAIDPSGVDLGGLPLVRLHRLEIDKLSDEVLTRLFHRAAMFRAKRAAKKFAQAMLDRPSLASREEALMACEFLTRFERRPERALEVVEHAGDRARQSGGPAGMYRLLEFQLRLMQGDSAGAQRLLTRIQSQHITEPGVAEALMQMLISLGLMNPDGTPVHAPSAAPAAADSGLLMPGSEAPSQAGRIWTPGSPAGPAPGPAAPPPSQKPGIWTP